MSRETVYKIIIVILIVIIIFLGAVVVFNISQRQARKISKFPKPPVPVKAKIAIVIDDLGYNLNNAEFFKELKYPLTFSVLPHLAYSETLAAELHRQGFEVILHLPMEPHQKSNIMESNTILTSMEEQKIKEIVDMALVSVPHIKGVSNHMGSKLTEDRRAMGIIFKVFKNRRLYFLDSFVTEKSVCKELAKKINLKFARRAIFLDNIQDARYIRGQIFQLKIKARDKKSTIGIGHDRRLTYEILKELMPELEKEGYRFVFVSELVS